MINNQKYIPELKITENDIKNENDRDKLKYFKNEIKKLVIDLKTTEHSRKINIEVINPFKITETTIQKIKGYPKIFYKEQIYKYFLTLIEQRQSELNELNKKSIEQILIQEDKEIIKELKNYVSKETFIEIIRKVKEKIKDNEK